MLQENRIGATPRENGATLMAKTAAKVRRVVPPASGTDAVRLDGRSPADEARAAGKALREKTPRSSHAKIGRLPAGRDPVAIVLASDKGRLKNVIPVRHSRMLESPFAFYRGTAAIQAHDLAHG